MGLVSLAVNQPSGRSLIGYVTQESTGFLYNKSESTFDAVVLADLPMDGRSNYRVPLVESPANTYRISIDASGWDDGEYAFLIREFVNLVEYPDLLSQGVVVSSGEMALDSLDFRIDTAEARTLIAYVYSHSRDMHYNTQAGALIPLDLNTATTAERTPFRIPYVEDAPGSYTARVQDSIPDGVYQITTVELVNEVEIEAGLPVDFTVRGGLRVTAPIADTVNLNHNTGGVDNLRYITANGVAIPDARITVYRTSDVSQGIYTSPVAVSSTDGTGRWTLPIRVDNSGAGAYTIVFEKEGSYGPDSAEV